MRPSERPADVLAEVVALAEAEARPVVLGVAADLYAPVTGLPSREQTHRLRVVPAPGDSVVAVERLARLLADAERLC
ncbi:hypothetical protein [Streptomyces sp. NPDC016845]|uniref:hypothetical protein n=1 Tax=Streptomyces sp. NPDC016845 TaxID=3364972 RepID=UPI0037A49023